MDFARSDDVAVQRQLDRLGALSVPQGRLGLDTIRALLARLGDPHLRLPPVFHVAGTNGKGSTCAFLRAMIEADGKRVHVTSSPHLVRYNERIRIAGELISDERLAALLAEVLDAGEQGGEDLNPSFFEITIAAAFTEFARVPADACVVEVGLGGRFDATNILEKPAACGIAALGIDHEQFLLAPEDGTPDDPMARIAFEKAGIAKQGCPLVTLYYDEAETLEIKRAAMAKGATLAMRGREWLAAITDSIHYADHHGELKLPLPAMPGVHQAENASLAVAMLRHQDFVSVSGDAMAEGIRIAKWPARLQRLAPGPLVGTREVWLDGGHNVSAGNALAAHFGDQPVHLIIGMLGNKNPSALTGALRKIQSITGVPVPGHVHHKAAAFSRNAKAAENIRSALSDLPDDNIPVLIAGTLYIAGEALSLNDELPD